MNLVGQPYTCFPLIRPKRIHNFCLCHAYIAPLLHILLELLYHFKSFFWTNLLTRCPVPVPVFCMFLVSEKLHRKSSREKSGKSLKIISRRKKPGARRPAPEAQQGEGAAPRRGPGSTRALGWRGAPGAPPAPTFCPIYCRDPKPPEARPFFQNSIPRRRHHQNPKTGVQQTCPGTLPEGEIVIGGFFITMPASGEMRE